MTSRPGLASMSQTRFIQVLLTRLWCVSIAPRDNPVVPPVYCSSARSVIGSIIATGALLPVAARFIRAAHRSVPGGTSALSCALRLPAEPRGRLSSSR